MKISGIRQIKRAEIKVDIFNPKNYKKWLSYYSILLFFWLKDEKWYYDLGLYEEKHFKNYRGFPFDLAAYVYDHVKEARIIITLTDSYKLYFGLKNYKKVDERHSLVVRDANNDLICWIDITVPENEEKRH